MAPIQNDNGILTFSLDNKNYTLNVNSEEERNFTLRQVNLHSQHKWDWFKESTGEQHWVLFNTEMYKKIEFDNDDSILHYNYTDSEGTENSNYSKILENTIIPTTPINATSCHHMFSNSESKNKHKTIDFSLFDTSNIVDMSYMFDGCTCVTLDLSSFNTSKVIDMRWMFAYCSCHHLNLSSFNTSNVINMSWMFGFCIPLRELDLSSFNTNKVTDISMMFFYCRSLKVLDLAKFNTSQVKTMERMFKGCSMLRKLNISNFNTANVENMVYMFAECSLEEIDLTNFSTNHLKNTSAMFDECNEVHSILVSPDWNTSHCDNTKDMFKHCYSLPTYDDNKRNGNMSKPIKDGGYLTVLCGYVLKKHLEYIRNEAFYLNPVPDIL